MYNEKKIHVVEGVKRVKTLDILNTLKYKVGKS